MSGLGDGLAVWYNAVFDETNRLLEEPEQALTAAGMRRRARAYRQVLSLFLALRRPEFYLVRDPEALANQTDRYLRVLAKAGVITRRLRNAGLRVRIEVRPSATPAPPDDFVSNKAGDAVRAELLGDLRISRADALDHLDLRVGTVMDRNGQNAVTDFFRSLADPQFVRKNGLTEAQLLVSGDPRKVIYSFTLYERGRDANLLRIETDNFNEPLNINRGVRLQLGSTAKLRTLINYLQIVEQLHDRYAVLPPAQLQTAAVQPGDRLTQWALAYLAAASDRGLTAMLNAALDRKFSASPAEAFFTAGGRHYFANFESSENGQILTVRNGFEHSVNLVFIRLMRDIEGYYRYRIPGASPAVLADPDAPGRRRYLQRFADQEGSLFLSRFYEAHHAQTPDQALESVVHKIRATPLRLAVLYRSVRPQAPLAAFTAFLETNLPAGVVRGQDMAKLYARYGPDRFNLSDRGYLSRVHPLELWLLQYLGANPHATLAEVLARSANQRQEVYTWLLRTSHPHAQDRRIETLMEQDAFREIWKVWSRLGYPFPSLVPSYATAIGVSGDTPRALAQLAGIVVNGGIGLPAVRIRQLDFGPGTPVETVMARAPRAAERLLSPEIAALVREEMIGVVRNGTGRRALNAFVLPGGAVLPVGGKTGTGDNRFKTFAAGGGLVSDRPVNPTATFVFFIGDRFFGVVTAFVPGQGAASFRFTSALAVQVLKDLAPRLMPLLQS